MTSRNDPRSDLVSFVDHDEFSRDPRAVMHRAEVEGPVAVRDAQGMPHMVIVIPSHALSSDDDF